ncbi:MAG: hypothetical protein GTO22_01860 [Gemmatimonadales bacterium]|nr:hypothetical protein [Gemmatimonadales bacterium]
MPHKTSKHGSYRLDRRFPGVGRIALASGATTRRGLKARNDLLTRLYDKGRLDLLRAIRDGQVTVTEVLDADRRDDLKALTDNRKALSLNLWDAVGSLKPAKGWLPNSAPALPSRVRYESSFKRLRKIGPLTDPATVGDLADIDWRALMATWGQSGSDWNHARRAVSKFVSDVLEDVHHPFRRDLMKRIPKRPERKRVPDITPGLLWKVYHAAPEHARASYVALALLGMDTGEYLKLTKDNLRPNTFSVELPGTKTKLRHDTIRVDKRLWPYIEAAVPSKLQYKWLRIYWKRALEAVKADTTLRLKDLRHCPAQWATEEGMSEAAVQGFMRHGDPNMTRRYAMQRDRGQVARAVANAMLRSA